MWSDDGTYRVVYTTEFAGKLYVIHAFKKKSKTGVGTPKKEIDLVRERLRKLKNILKKQ